MHREVEPGLRRQNLQMLDHKLPIFADSDGDIEEIPARKRQPILKVSEMD